MLLYNPVASDEVYEDLQDDRDQYLAHCTQQWVDANYLSFNTNKCKSMLVSRKRDPRPASLYLGETVLEQVETFKYLGMLFVFRPYMDASCTKYLL